jgi:galactokinase
MVNNKSLKTRIDNIVTRHKSMYGNTGPIQVFSAPGRVNIIGEHTDYNGGYVLPAAIDMNILAAVSTRTDRELHLKSENIEEKVTAPIDGLKYDTQRNWGNFPLSIAWVLEKHGIKLPGANILFESTVPLGSGLSSSAAIEVLMMQAMLSLAGVTIDKKQIPRFCQEAENSFIGVKSGIMDQYIITFGKENAAVYLDCESLEHRLIPFSSGETTAIIVGNTKVKRELAKSAYNQRVDECAEGVRIFSKLSGRQNIKNLSNVTEEEFKTYRNALPECIARRCEHVIFENQRVKLAVESLGKGDLATLGKLLLQSHASLRDLYEVSCHELDYMVEAFMQSGDVYGARMTGAGFGGSAIAFAKADKAEEVVTAAQRYYEQKTGIKGDFYICKISEGAGPILSY